MTVIRAKKQQHQQQQKCPNSFLAFAILVQLLLSMQCICGFVIQQQHQQQQQLHETLRCSKTANNVHMHKSSYKSAHSSNNVQKRMPSTSLSESQPQRNGFGFGTPFKAAKPHVEIGQPAKELRKAAAAAAQYNGVTPPIQRYSRSAGEVIVDEDGRTSFLPSQDQNLADLAPYEYQQQQEEHYQLAPASTQQRSTNDLWSHDIVTEQSIINGNSLKTYSFTSSTQRAEVFLKNEQGRPIDAEVELWSGPMNVPCRVRVFVEDGLKRSFRAMFEMKGKRGHSVAVKNVGNVQNPFTSGIFVSERNQEHDDYTNNNAAPAAAAHYNSQSELINQGPAHALSQFSSSTTRVQGGAMMYTQPFQRNVQSVQVMLCTNVDYALHAKIELYQGPKSDKQFMEVYSENGLKCPFYAILETPGAGNVVRVTNLGTLEFPLYTTVEPYLETMEKPRVQFDAPQSFS